MTRKNEKRLGVTVMPESLQSEGVRGVLENVRQRLGGTSVTTSPYVAVECAPHEGYREPPLDGGAGAKRLLDRPLWGKREVYMRTAPSFRPSPELYAKTTYAPETPTELTEAHGGLIQDFVQAGSELGMTTYLQVMAAIPPCLRVQFGGPHPHDQPMMPDGTTVPARVDRNASLASADVREYVRAMVKDLCRNYPEVSGFKFDWPEYPPYHFMSLFADYNAQVEPYAQALGINLTSLAKAVIEKVRTIRELSHEWNLQQEGSFLELLGDLRARDQVVDDHFRLRSHLAVNYAEFLRECVDEASGGTKKMLLQGFPPPWNTLSGFDARKLATIADELAIKFYTMHWPMIGANYVKFASAAFDRSPREIASFFSRHFMGANSEPPASGQFSYPEPDMPHGISTDRIKAAYADLGISDAIGITHTYGPIDDVIYRFRALLEATDHNIEVNRYEYISDEKMEALSKLLVTAGSTRRLSNDA